MAEKMDIIRIRCPECSKKLGFPASAIGRTAKCPGCSHTFRIPDSAQPAAAPAPSRPAPAPPQTSDQNIKTHCPACDKRLTFPGTAIGRKAKCPACQHVFVVAEEAAASSHAMTSETPPAPQPPPTESDGDDFRDDSEPNSLYDDLASAEQSAEGAPPDIAAMAQAQAAATAVMTTARHDSKTSYPADSSFAKGAASAGLGAIGRATSAVGPLAKGTLFSAAAAVLGAFVWYGIAKATEYEIGYVAWGIGLLVGFAMHIGMQQTESGLAGAIAALMALGGVILGKVMVVAWVLFPMLATADTADSLKEQREEIISYYTDQAVEKKDIKIDKPGDTQKYAQEYEKAEAEAKKKVSAMSAAEVKQEYERVQAAQQRDELVEHYTEKNLEDKNVDSEDATEEQAKQARADAKEKVDAMSADEVKRDSERIASDNLKELTSKAPTGLWVLFIAMFFGIRGIIFTILAAVTAFKIGAGGISFGKD